MGVHVYNVHGVVGEKTVDIIYLSICHQQPYIVYLSIKIPSRWVADQVIIPVKVRDRTHLKTKSTISLHFSKLQRSTPHAATANPMAEFNPEIDEWVLNQERLENYFEVCTITEDNCKKMGAKEYKLVRDRSTPVTHTC